MKYTLDKHDKEVIREAMAIYQELANKYYDQNPGFFSRDLWEIYEDLLEGIDWESDEYGPH